MIEVCPRSIDVDGRGGVGNPCALLIPFVRREGCPLRRIHQEHRAKKEYSKMIEVCPRSIDVDGRGGVGNPCALLIPFVRREGCPLRRIHQEHRAKKVYSKMIEVCPRSEFEEVSPDESFEAKQGDQRGLRLANSSSPSQLEWIE